MESIMYMMKKLSIGNLEIGSLYWVDITYINSPDSFFVRPLRFKPYMTLIQARGEHMDASEINVGTIVVFKSNVVRSYVRGKVLFIDGDAEPLYDLFVMDFGCCERSVQLKNIWSPLNKLDLPSLVIHCQLADCAPKRDAWDAQAIAAMRNYVLGEKVKIRVRGKAADAVVVELYNSGPDDIGTLLIISGHACIGFCRNHFERVRRKPVAPRKLHYCMPRELQINTAMHVRMQSGSTQYGFYVTLIDEYKTYEETVDDFTSEVMAKREISLKDIELKKPIAVYHHLNNKFERAFVKEVFPKHGKVRAQLVDWGVEIVASIGSLRPVPEAYQYIPARAIHCCLHDRQLYGTNMKHIRTPGPEFMITIEEIGKVDSPNIVTISLLKN